MTEKPTPYQLTHPVYLDVPMMESFLAHLEGGLIKGTEETETVTGARERLIKGRIGIRTRFIPALSADAAAEGQTQRRDETAYESRMSRHHTDASLFNLLYDYLREDTQIADLAEPNQLAGIRSGQLIEVSGVYLGNPLEDTLTLMSSMLPYVLAAQEHEKEEKARKEAAQPRQLNRNRQQVNKGRTPPQVPSADEVVATALAQLTEQASAESVEMGIKMVLQMAEDLASVPVHDLLLRTTEGLDAVLTVASEFYSANTREFLRAGEFRVVGKVTRVLADDDTIDLTRRTILAASPDTALEVINAMRTPLAVESQDPIVQGPAVQILPMAIFI